MKVLGFGAVLWDDIADPAAPPADSVAGEANIGGAVFNVVVHLQRLGYAAYMLSAIGRDPLGERTWRELDRLGIRRDFIASVAAPTCLIEVTFDSAGQPHYSSPDVVSWDRIEARANLVAEVDAVAFDVLVFGTLEQRSSASRATLRRVLEGARFEKVFLDLTLRGDFYDRDLLDYSMRRADIIKMNDDEARVVNELFGFGRRAPAGAAAADRPRVRRRPGVHHPGSRRRARGRPLARAPRARVTGSRWWTRWAAAMPSAPACSTASAPAARSPRPATSATGWVP